jgi:uncharacterized protein (TIGR03437 family)
MLGPNHIEANVEVAAKAPLGLSDITVISGFQVATQPKTMQTAPVSAKLPTIALVTNGILSQATLYPGGYGTIWGVNLAGADASTKVALDDRQVAVAYAGVNQVNFVIPSDMATGPATLRLNNGVDDALALVLQIDPAPPAIASVAYISDPGPNADHPAADGSVLNVLVTGLDPTVLANPGRVRVTLGAASMKLGAITAGSTDGVYQIQVTLTQPPSGDRVPLAVWVDGSSSGPVYIPVKQPAPVPVPAS